jgi:flagellum-specific peptidoglycan hydrolase FlgJ
MATEVSRTRTTPTTEEWRDAMVAAADRLGISLNDAALSVLWAQWALETGRGKSCYCNNLGNIKAVTGDGRDWCVLQTFEFINGHRVDMADKFRAFGTLAEGAYDYLQFLSRDGLRAAMVVRSGSVIPTSSRARSKRRATSPPASRNTRTGCARSPPSTCARRRGSGTRCPPPPTTPRRRCRTRPRRSARRAP